MIFKEDTWSAILENGKTCSSNLIDILYGHGNFGLFDPEVMGGSSED